MFLAAFSRWCRAVLLERRIDVSTPRTSRVWRPGQSWKKSSRIVKLKMSTFFWHQNIVLACLSCVLPSGANTIIAQFGPHLLPLIILKGLYWIFCYLYILFVGLRQAGGNNTRWHEFRWTGGILIPPFWETTLIRQKDCWFHFPLRWQWRIWLPK